MADVFRTAGNIELYTSEDTDTVLHYFDLSYKCYEIIQDTSSLARLLTNYAIIYENREELARADSAFQKAIYLYQTTGNKSQKANIYLDYATFLANRFKASKEKNGLTKAISFFSKQCHWIP